MSACESGRDTGDGYSIFWVRDLENSQNVVVMAISRVITVRRKMMI